MNVDSWEMHILVTYLMPTICVIVAMLDVKQWNEVVAMINIITIAMVDCLFLLSAPEALEGCIVIRIVVHDDRYRCFLPRSASCFLRTSLRRRPTA
jgi:hypothetical protein